MTEEQYAQFDRLCAFLGRFTYKPGWVFQPYIGPFGPAVDIRATVLDCDRPGREITITSQHEIPHHNTDDEYFMRWFRAKINDFERHETDEFFKVDGVKIFDPH